jgi:hypothetical protein
VGTACSPAPRLIFLGTGTHPPFESPDDEDASECVAAATALGGPLAERPSHRVAATSVHKVIWQSPPITSERVPFHGTRLSSIHV